MFSFSYIRRRFRGNLAGTSFLEPMISLLISFSATTIADCDVGSIASLEDGSSCLNLEEILLPVGEVPLLRGLQVV